MLPFREACNATDRVFSNDPPAFGGASELKAQMEAIASDLGKVGIKVETTLTDLAGYLANTKDNDIAVTVYGNSGNDIGVASLYFRRPPTTYQTPADPRYPQLLADAEVALDADTQFPAETIRALARIGRCMLTIRKTRKNGFIDRNAASVMS